MNKGEIYFREFKDIFLNPENYLQNDGLDLLHLFTSDSLKLLKEGKIDELKSILQRLETDLEDYNEENDRCPKCNEDLVTTSKKDTETLEHFGTQCRQTVHIKKCPYCGWKEDD